MTNDWTMKLLATTMVLCAVIVTASTARRVWVDSSRPGTVSRTPARVDGAFYASRGIRIGAPNARLVIVEFVDFQCPFCSRFEESLRVIRAEFGDQIATIYRHFPLDRLHPAAFAAALGAECALAQGHFESYRDVLFRHAVDVGTVPWETMASRAGIADTVKFGTCVRSREFEDRVHEDKRAASALGARGTPTVIIGDSVYYGVIRTDDLRRHVAAALAADR